MWAMTSFGILMPAIRPPHTVAKGDDRTMQIRTRRAKDLDILRARYMSGSLGPNIHTPNMDYEYRAYCVPHAFALAMAAMVLDVDYLKFKPTTETKFGDRELHDCYNAIWSTVMNVLSTKRHQWEYWHGRTPHTGRTTTVGRKGVKLGKQGTATSTGWTDVVADDWAGYADWWSRNGHRDTGADRDAYEPDPALRDLVGSYADDFDEIVTRTERVEIDTLYDEIDALVSEAERIDHTQCEHAASDNARARCRRRKRRALEAQVETLRARIDDLYTEADETYTLPALPAASDTPAAAAPVIPAPTVATGDVTPLG